jgi:ligand-binding SRPBCC domain-containing protein
MPLRWLMRIESQTGGIQDDGRVKFSVGAGPLRMLWEARHFGYVRGKQFCDEQVQGPFTLWRHTHRIEAIDAHRSLYEDRIDYALPGGPWMQKLMTPIVARLLAIMFARRHAIVRSRFAGA